MKKNQYLRYISFILFLSSNLYASLSNHPLSYSETVTKGSSKTMELHISNSISTPLNYSFIVSKNWLSVTPSTGSVGGNQTITVILKFDATALTEGDYSTTISLNDPHHGGINIPIQITVISVTGIREEKDNPSDFRLNQNYPNPFNPSTTITFSLPVAQNVVLTIYNAIGIEIKSLLNKFLSSGNYSIKFDAADYPSGIYFYRIKTDQFTQTKKMILTK